MTGLFIFAKTGQRGFLALASKRWPLGKNCLAQTLFILAWPIVWHQRWALSLQL